MSNNLKKLSIQGSTDTLNYQFNVSFDGLTSTLTWLAFRKYSPIGTQTDGDGLNYFDINEGNFVLEQDPDLSYELYIYSTYGVVKILKIWEDADQEDADHPGVTLGQEGDIFISCMVPRTGDGDPEIEYKEVLR